MTDRTICTNFNQNYTLNLTTPDTVSGDSLLQASSISNNSSNQISNLTNYDYSPILYNNTPVSLLSTNSDQVSQGFDSVSNISNYGESSNSNDYWGCRSRESSPYFRDDDSKREKRNSGNERKESNFMVSLEGIREATPSPQSIISADGTDDIERNSLIYSEERISLKELSPEERYLRQRDQNNKASGKYRNKKNQELSLILEKAELLEKENTSLLEKCQKGETVKQKHLCAVNTAIKYIEAHYPKEDVEEAKKIIEINMLKSKLQSISIFKPK